MKKNLFVITLTVFSLFFVNYSFSQSSLANSKELILGIPSVNSKNYNEIKSTLSSIEGVAIVGYCETYKFFLITFDNAKVKSGETISKIIESKYPGIKTEIKTGTSISKIINECTKFPLQ